jgi:transposase
MNEVVAGIDVSAKVLMVCVLLVDGRSKSFEVENTPKGHTELIALCRKLGVAKIVCEATGIYHLELAFALVGAELRLMVANPRQIRAFMEARLRHTKTDKVDAFEIAQFAARMDFVAWVAPSAKAYAVFRLARAIHGYTELATAAKNRLHAAEAVRQTPKLVLKTLRLELASYERWIANLTQEALAEIGAEARLKRRYELLLSVPGIAQTSAVALLGELSVLSDSLSAKAWIKLCGLDPRLEQSGTSINRKTRLSKHGNSKMRGAGFMPAMSARRFDPGLKAFADRLIAHGKTKMQAILAVERKLFHGIHAMFRTNKPWDSSLLVKA